MQFTFFRMSTKSNNPFKFWQELKRRNVVRRNTVYAATEAGAWRRRDGEDWQQIASSVVTKIKTHPYTGKQKSQIRNSQ